MSENAKLIAQARMSWDPLIRDLADALEAAEAERDDITTACLVASERANTAEADNRRLREALEVYANLAEGYQIARAALAGIG